MTALSRARGTAGNGPTSPTSPTAAWWDRWDRLDFFVSPARAKRETRSRRISEAAIALALALADAGRDCLDRREAET
jgi:hypothetical protein